MARLVRNLGLELPVYGEGAIVFRDPGQADTSHPTFIRAVQLKAEGAKSLKDALFTADRAFDTVATRCGAQVVRHAWGLWKATDIDPEDIIPPEFLPKDHMLVAEVDVIKALTPPDARQIAAINRASTTYLDSSKGSLVWFDAFDNNFSNGIGADQSSADLWLLDIEPLLTFNY